MTLGFLDRLQRKVLVCDGATGTSLYARGMPADGSPELWTREHQDVMLGLHNEYIAAGADIILTNSLGTSRIKLAKYGIGDMAKELNHDMAAIAAQAAADAGRTVYVGGDIGATGEFMAPLGTLSEEELIDVFAEQAAGLVDGGADIIYIETMMDINEAAAAVKGARQACELPVIASVSFNTGRAGYRTMMGNTPTQAAELLLAAGADVVGANCGSVIAEHMPDIVREMRAAGATYVAIEPNAGVPEIIDGATVFSQSPEQMAESVPEILDAGANIIGGCCGTTPAHIRLIAEIVRSRAR